MQEALKIYRDHPCGLKYQISIISFYHYISLLDLYYTTLKFKEIIVDAITTITNQSLTTGEFLDDWKVVAVRPLIKNPNIGTEFKNYRPVSNRSFLSKIIEKAAQVQLQKHFDEQSLLPNHQSAYRQHFSTETTVLNMCDNILKIWKLKNIHELSAWISVLLLTLLITKFSWES